MKNTEIKKPRYKNIAIPTDYYWDVIYKNASAMKIKNNHLVMLAVDEFVKKNKKG